MISKNTMAKIQVGKMLPPFCSSLDAHVSTA